MTWFYRRLSDSEQAARAAEKAADALLDFQIRSIFELHEKGKLTERDVCLDAFFGITWEDFLLLFEDDICSCCMEGLLNGSD